MEQSTPPNGPADARRAIRAQGLSTYRQRARLEIEIGTWGSLCTAVLFFSSGIAAYYTSGKMTWLSTLGCLTGLATIAIIVVRAYLSSATVRARKALRKLGSG